MVSRLLVPDSVPARAVRQAMAEGRVLASDATMAELADVLSRRKFDPYATIEARKAFLRLLGRIVEIVPVVVACRDPGDDKFLEPGVNGEASYIVTGDADSRVLNPYRGIAIVTPSAFLAERDV
ncbi:MAG TPA: putative toxin-antitoxin system toxin component, PIN family, partial [Rhodopila sp.]|nr:putative toxin-antitoxin system toxin component, PIN family [Rhodopila sp.]